MAKQGKTSKCGRNVKKYGAFSGESKRPVKKGKNQTTRNFEARKGNFVSDQPLSSAVMVNLDALRAELQAADDIRVANRVRQDRLSLGMAARPLYDAASNRYERKAARKAVNRAARAA